MHRVVLFSTPVVSNGEELYGRLYGGATASEILIVARVDFKTLLIREQWEGGQGEAFRQQEGWNLVPNEDGTSAWWSFNKDRYTFNKGFDPVPDQFVEHCQLPSGYVALLSGWIPIRMSDTNIEDYIINGAFYYTISSANPNDICWYRVDESDDDLPF